MAGAGLIFLVTSGVGAQQPDAAPQEKAAKDDATDMAVSLRYRFSEKYGVVEEPGQPELIVQYQVGAVETYRIETEKATGAPDRQELTCKTMYTERPAKVGRLGEVVDAVRRYDSFRVTSAPATHARLSRLFQGLSLWLHMRNGPLPEFICLQKDRSIREDEYQRMVVETSFLRLMAVMPPQTRPVRIKDKWMISRPGVMVLMGEVPDLGDSQLEATLVEVRKSPQGTALSAIIEITGDVELEAGTRKVDPRIGTVDARITFNFEPPPAAPAPAPAATPRPAGAPRPRIATRSPGSSTPGATSPSFRWPDDSMSPSIATAAFSRSTPGKPSWRGGWSAPAVRAKQGSSTSPPPRRPPTRPIPGSFTTISSGGSTSGIPRTSGLAAASTRGAWNSSVACPTAKATSSSSRRRPRASIPTSSA